ncbi:hypothetical protein ACIPEP_02010 [Curtobacterium sp. NPDC087082]|uniref:hypothetical protein n=1 Tax=Curtobacterium sp. NPDC087082 TaxID=3363966 RepID=UPI0037F65888
MHHRVLALAVGSATAVGLALGSAPAIPATAVPAEPSVTTTTAAADTKATDEVTPVPLEVTSDRTYTLGEPIAITGRATPGAVLVITDPVRPGTTIGFRVDDTGVWNWTSPAVHQRSVTIHFEQVHADLGIEESLDVEFVNDEADREFAPLAITSDTTYTYGQLLTVSGRATPNATVQFTDRNDPDSTWSLGRADNAGNWTITSVRPIRKPTLTLTITQYHVGTDRSETVAVDFANDDPGAVHDPIVLETPRTYRVGTEVTLRGTAIPGSLIGVSGEGVPTELVQADDRGNWSVPAFRATADEYTVLVTQTSPDCSFRDRERFTLLGHHADLTYQRTVFKHGEPLTVAGTGTPGATLDLLADGAVIGTTTVADSGRWSLTTSTALQGPRLRAQVRQTAEGIGSESIDATFIATGIRVPIEVTSEVDYEPGSPLTISGTAAPNATLTFNPGPTPGNGLGNMRADSTGHWTRTIDYHSILWELTIHQQHWTGNDELTVQVFDWGR